MLAQLGLTPAVRELLRQFESRTDLAVQADLDDVGKPESQALLYRAARELLTNIGKHAKAATVWVGLMRKGDRIVLTIDDDGAGFDSAIVAQYVADGHIGLGSLLARFDAMGGAMDINSQIGYGTQVMRRRRGSRSPLPAGADRIKEVTGRGKCTPWQHIWQTGRRSTSSGSTLGTRRGTCWCPRGSGPGTTPSSGWANRRRCHGRRREREFSS